MFVTYETDSVAKANDDAKKTDTNWLMNSHISITHMKSLAEIERLDW